MAYASPAELKTYIGGFKDTTDDALLAELLERATSIFEGATGRVFAVETDSTKTFDAVGDHVRGYVLYLDEADLCAITSVTNGDGVAVSTSEYTTLPRNATPYFGLRLLASAGKTWTYSTDWEDAISIVGRWGYSTTPPLDVQQATLDIAKMLYRSRGEDGADRMIVAEGMIVHPASFSPLVKATIDRYRRAW